MSKYKKVFAPENHRADKNGYVEEHIIVVEQKLGRQLREKEVVHHKDQNPFNNDPNNLIVFATTSDHTRFHNGGTLEQKEDYYISKPTYQTAKKALSSGISVEEYLRRFQDFEYLLNNCPICGGRCTNKYCSQKCYYIGKRKVTPPSKKELEVLIKTTSFLQIGKMYGVSDNAVRKWCKKYNLPFRKKDIN